MQLCATGAGDGGGVAHAQPVQLYPSPLASSSAHVKVLNQSQFVSPVQYRHGESSG